VPSASIAPAPPPDPGPPLTAEEAAREVHRLFDAGPESGLTIRVYGEPGEPADDALREMVDSLRMHDAGCRADGELFGRAPTRASIARALRVLGREPQRRRVLEHVLTSFGHRLVDPLGDILDDAPAGAVAGRLVMMRALFASQIAELRLTPDVQRTLAGDVEGLLSDAYLQLLAETEEQVERPRVRRLARELLRALGTIFQRAIEALPGDADRLADGIAERLWGEHPLKELPALVRRELVAELEDWLREATSAELEEARGALFARHGEGIAPAPLPREAYRELADWCWSEIARCC
jgi:hypothetical protein